MRVEVDRKALIQRLRSNRLTHRNIFLEAVEGYKVEAVKQLEDFIARIKSGSLKHVYVSLPTPEDHTGDYDRIIGLLGLSEEETVPLDDSSYASYYMDDWTWKRQFLTSNSLYSVTAASSLPDYDDD